MIGGVREQVVQQLCHIVLLGTQVEAVDHQDDTPAQRKIISQLQCKILVTTALLFMTHTK